MYKLGLGSYISMGWKFVSYVSSGRKYVFHIEPMMNGGNIVYYPENNDEAAKMIEKIKSIPWNRDLVYQPCNEELICINKNDQEFPNGSLESTKGGMEFTNNYLFDPIVGFKSFVGLGTSISKEKAHEIWCTLEKRFAEQATGIVTIYASDYTKNSVFEKVTIPALQANPNITFKIQE